MRKLTEEKTLEELLAQQVDVLKHVLTILGGGKT
jgi:hypothetical protein